MRWEYWVVTVVRSRQQDQLNEAGQLGWELVSAVQELSDISATDYRSGRVSVTDRVTLYFKRAIQSQQDES